MVTSKNSDSICIEHLGTCRTRKQIFFIALCRMREFFKLVDKNLKSDDESFLYQVELNLSNKGISRFSFLVDDNSVTNNIDGQLEKDLPIFKICVPTSYEHKSYIDFHCPLTDCDLTFEQSAKCVADKNIENGNIVITKNLTGQNGLHSLK